MPSRKGETLLYLAAMTAKKEPHKNQEKEYVKLKILLQKIID